MNSDTQLKIQAYLDNELSPGEARKIAAMLSSDRDLQELYGELRATKESLRVNEPEVKLAESREFYWSQIQRRIATAEREPAPRTVRPFWIRLLAPLAGTAALCALLLAVMNPSTRIPTVGGAGSIASAADANDPLHGEVEDLAPEDVSSVTFRSEEHGVTVVWLTASQ
jgi:anti-sigma factor RsiW